MRTPYIIRPPVLLAAASREVPQDISPPDALELKEYETQFEELLKTPAAKQYNMGVVYWWKTEKPMPRLVGESNILYIGQSKTSFSERYYNSKSFQIEKKYFQTSYQHIIKKYGPITIEIRQSEDPKYDEWYELDKYQRKHIEYPPLNRAIPSRPPRSP